MSVNHPYLKQLKAHILQFCEHKGLVRDDHPSLLNFFTTLEDIIRNGLKGVTSKFSTEVQKSYWLWMRALLKKYSTRKLTGSLQLSIEFARDNKKAIYPIGKGRLVLRCVLNKGLLAHCFKLLREDKAFLLEYYDEISILADDILSEMLLSLLAPLDSHVCFALNIRNCSFLDETWQLPWFRRFEMVPCKKLGMELLAVGGRLMVVEVEPGSVADEDMKIEPGDVVDDLFGEPLRQGSIRKAVALMEDYQGSPVYVSVVKCIGKENTFYRPIFPYLDEAGLCKQVLINRRNKRFQEWRDTTIVVEQGCSLPSAGICWGGDTPDEDLEGANQGLVGLSAGDSSGSIFRKGDMTESGMYRVKFWGFANVGRVLLQHGYPEISSCGRRVDYPLNFAYIAGETTCTLAKTFTCFVFEAVSDEQAKVILKGIADGFDRTHWAV